MRFKRLGVAAVVYCTNGSSPGRSSVVVAIDAPSRQYHVLKFVNKLRAPAGTAFPMPSSLPALSSYGNTGVPPSSAGHDFSQAPTIMADTPLTTRSTCAGVLIVSAVIFAFANTVSVPDFPCWVPTVAPSFDSLTARVMMLSCVGPHSYDQSYIPGTGAIRRVTPPTPVNACTVNRCCPQSQRRSSRSVATHTPPAPHPASSTHAIPVPRRVVVNIHAAGSIFTSSSMQMLGPVPNRHASKSFRRGISLPSRMPETPPRRITRYSVFAERSDIGNNCTATRPSSFGTTFTFVRKELTHQLFAGARAGSGGAPS